MRIRVVYLGGSRGQTGCSSEIANLEAGSTVADVATWVAQRHPRLAPLLPNVRWARNHEFAEGSEAVHDDDEVAVLPPVAGGAPVAHLTEHALEPQEILQRVAGDDAGATVLFVGTVRNHSRGKDVSHLHYEAYQPMAQKQLERIAQTSGSDHGDARVYIAHRYGELRVGDISVVIAAASAHRDAAFAACRTAIERIKVDVPIWKQEFTTDGEHWVGWGGG